MLLPNAENAIVDIRKLRDYCLNSDNPRGRHKARVFAATLDLNATDAEYLRSELLKAVLVAEAELGELDIYGQRYTVDFMLETCVGKKAVVRTGWFVLHGEANPRLATCFIKKEKQ